MAWHRWLGAILAMAMVIPVAVAESDALGAAARWVAEAEGLAEAGDLDTAVARYLDAIAGLEAVADRGEVESHLAVIQARAADLLEQNGKADRALRMRQAAVRAGRGIAQDSTEGRRFLILQLLALSRQAFGAGRDKTAENALEAAGLNLMTADGRGAWDLYLAAAWAAEGGAQRRHLGDMAGARALLEKSVAMRRGLARDDDPERVADLVVTLIELGDSLAALGEWAGARKAYKAALAALDRLDAIGDVPMLRADALWSLAMTGDPGALARLRQQVAAGLPARVQAVWQRRIARWTAPAERILSPAERARLLDDTGPVRPDRGAVDACDRLAGDPYDPAGVIGTLARVDGRNGPRACRAALAHHPDDPRRRYQLGRALMWGRMPDLALAELTAAAEAGHAMAWYELGEAWRKGWLTGRPDWRQAASALEKARDAGICVAAWSLAKRHAGGHGVPVDRERARALMTEAAECGMAEAHYALAISLGADHDAPAEALSRALSHGAAAVRLARYYGRHGILGPSRLAVQLLAARLDPEAAAQAWAEGRAAADRQIAAASEQTPPEGL